MELTAHRIEVTQGPEIGILLGGHGPFVVPVVGNSGRWDEFEVPETARVVGINNRIEDDIHFVMKMHAYDGPDLGGEALRLPIVVIGAELEIHAVKRMCGLWHEAARTVPRILKPLSDPPRPRSKDSTRHIETLLKPVSDAVGPFGGAVDRVVGNDAARVVGSLPADRGEIGVYHQIEYALIRNLCIVDLNLVRLCYRHYRNRKQNEKQRSAASGTLAIRSELPFSLLVLAIAKLEGYNFQLDFEF